MTEKTVHKIKFTTAEYRRDRNRNIGIYISPTFSHIAETKKVVNEPNVAIWKNVATGNCVLQLWIMRDP